MMNIDDLKMDDLNFTDSLAANPDWLEDEEPNRILKAGMSSNDTSPTYPGMLSKLGKLMANSVYGTKSSKDDGTD